MTAIFPIRPLARPAGLALVLLLLGACAGQVADPPPPGSWGAQRQSLEQLDAWTATGKVAVRSTGASESGSMVWQQRGNVTQVRLSGPVGMGATTVISDGATLQVNRDGEQRVIDVATPGAIERETGWDLPLAALPWWLRGLPAPVPAEHTLVLHSQGQWPDVLEQDGWRVTYGGFEPVSDLLLPTRLDIERGDTRARVIIRQWAIAGDAGGAPAP